MVSAVPGTRRTFISTPLICVQIDSAVPVVKGRVFSALTPSNKARRYRSASFVAGSARSMRHGTSSARRTQTGGRADPRPDDADQYASPPGSPGELRDRGRPGCHFPALVMSPKLVFCAMFSAYVADRDTSRQHVAKFRFVQHVIPPDRVCPVGGARSGRVPSISPDASILLMP